MFKTQFAGLFIPHSDLLRLLYSYGFIVATLFLSWFLRSGRKYPALGASFDGLRIILL